MKKYLLAFPLMAVLALGSAVPARAGASTDAALALGAFAVLNQLVRGETILHGVAVDRPVVHQTVVVQRPPTVVYQPAPVVYQPAPVVVRYYYPVSSTYVYWRVPPGHAKHWNKHAKKHHYDH